MHGQLDDDERDDDSDAMLGSALHKATGGCGAETRWETTRSGFTKQRHQQPHDKTKSGSR